MNSSNRFSGKKFRKFQFPDFSRKLVRVQYPGIVEDVDQMMKTIGGMENLEIAVANPNRRLELRFQPNDLYRKPCTGEKDYKCGILLKVKTRQPKWDPNQPRCSKDIEPDLNAGATYSYEVVGISAMNFVFKRLCDFQFLPLVPLKGKKDLQFIYPEIFPYTLPTPEWLMNPSPLGKVFFLPPSVYSRFDAADTKLFAEQKDMYASCVRPDLMKAHRPQKKKEKKQVQSDVLIGTQRKSRKTASLFANFTSRFIPREPPAIALKVIEDKVLREEPYERLKQLFQERPIWSKTALMHKSQMRKDQMKLALPTVAYHFRTGPWRVMWVKYGYDPRLDPQARIYQTFDYRIRETWGLKLKVQAKRGYSTLLSYKGGPTTNKKFSLNDDLGKKPVKEQIDERHYSLKPGMIPPARQMFYQFCDIQLPEIEQMIRKLPNVMPGTKCDAKNGWFPSGFSDQCREIVNKAILQQVKQEMFEEKLHRAMKIKKALPVPKPPEENKPLVILEIDDDDDLEIIQLPSRINDDNSDSELDNVLKDDVGTAEGDADEILLNKLEEIQEHLRSQSDEDEDEDELDFDAVADVNTLIDIFKIQESIQVANDEYYDDDEIDSDGIEEFSEYVDEEEVDSD